MTKIICKEEQYINSCHGRIKKEKNIIINELPQFILIEQLLSTHNNYQKYLILLGNLL